MTVQRYFSQMANSQLSRESKDKIRDVLSTVLGSAKDYDLLVTNPAFPTAINHLCGPRHLHLTRLANVSDAVADNDHVHVLLEQSDFGVNDYGVQERKRLVLRLMYCPCIDAQRAGKREDQQEEDALIALAPFCMCPLRATVEKSVGRQ
jgi:hypothetical protein